MSKPQSFKCWDITQCQNRRSCPVSRYEDKPCWEVAREMMNYQSTLNVCEDCFVYIALSGKNNSSLTEDEINHIWEQKRLRNMPSEYLSPYSEGMEAVQGVMNYE